MKIRTKIQISGLIVVLLVLVVSITGIYFFAALNMRSSIKDHIQIMADSRAEQVKIYLQGIEGRVYDFSIDGTISTCLANITGVKDGSCTVTEASENLLINKLISAKEFDEIYIFDNEKIVIASTKKDSIGRDVKNEIPFIKGTQQTYISSIYFTDEENNETSFKVAAPVKYSGQDIGYIVAVVDMSPIQNILQNEKGLNETSDIYLVDHKGLIQTRSRQNENTTLKQTINNDNFRQCINDMDEYLNDNGDVEKHYEEVIDYVTFSGNKVVGAHSYIEDQGLCLIDEVTKQEINSLLKPVLVYMLVMGLAILLLFFIISYKLIGKITYPLVKLTDEVNHVADGFYKHKFRRSEYEEYDNLSKAIDRVTDIIDDFRKEKKDKEKEE